MGRRVAATPRPRRGYGPSRGDAAAATWTYERDRRASHRYLATFSVYALGGAGWRGLFLLPAAPALAQLLLLPGTPESARWLRAARGPAAAEAAHAELYRRWGKTDAPPPPPASEPEATWTDAWAWRVPYLAFVVQSFLTFSTGGFTLQVFAVPVLRAAGCSPRTVRTVMILLGSAKLVATAVILVGIDRWNRVPVLEKSLLATAACGAALAFASGPVVAIAIMILWRAVFQFGFGSLNFVLLGELFPAGVKGRLVALEIIPSSAWNFASSYMFSRALDAGFLAPLLIVQACVAVLGALVVRLFAVETRGRTPHEIRAALRGAAAKEDAVAAPEVEMRERKPSDEKRPGAMLLEADGDSAAVT